MEQVVDLLVLVGGIIPHQHPPQSQSALMVVIMVQLMVMLLIVGQTFLAFQNLAVTLAMEMVMASMFIWVSAQLTY